MRSVRHLLEMIRFSHTLFALPFALLAAVMAWAANWRGDPPIEFRWQDLAGILACMVFVRSAAMAFNRLADRRLDALNPRTKMRHLPTGTLSVASVVLFTAISSLGFVAGTLLFLPRNPLPFWFSVPVLLFLFAYSLAKRFTVLAHFWLGAALMFAAWGGYALFWYGLKLPCHCMGMMFSIPSFFLIALDVLLFIISMVVGYLLGAKRQHLFLTLLLGVLLGFAGFAFAQWVYLEM